LAPLISTAMTPAVSSRSDAHCWSEKRLPRKANERSAVSSSFDWYSTWNATTSMFASAM
jgi:hypothetical protein